MKNIHHIIYEMIHHVLPPEWLQARASNRGRVGDLVQWLNLPAWKVRDRGFEPHSGILVSMEQNVSSLLTREY